MVKKVIHTSLFLITRGKSYSCRFKPQPHHHHLFMLLIFVHANTGVEIIAESFTELCF